MLDLTAAVSTELYEIKMLDGKVLHLKRPTQALQQTIVQMKSDDDESNLVEVITAIFVRIINRNTEGITYTEKDFEEDYDITLIGMVVQDYFEYWTKEIMNKVNFH